jgi:anti-sigma regulatory factor (Ser/Thr protein kinase)
MPMTDELRLSLPPHAESVPLARRAVVDAASRWLTPGQCPALALMVSEVVTNALLHGGSKHDVELTLSSEDDVLRVEVCDHGQGFVPEPRALDNGRDGGYGLYLVEQLADRWGWERDDCTLVWFEVALHPQPAAAVVLH